MVEDGYDCPVETKPNFVDYSVKIQPPKVEASVKVEPLHVNFGVSELGANEVDTTQFFSSHYTFDNQKGLDL